MRGDVSVQRKVFRIEQTFVTRRGAAPASVLTGDHRRRLTRARDELHAAIEGMEKATQRILQSAERIGNGAGALATASSGPCIDAPKRTIQEQVLQIFEAANFQDLAGQRIAKVIALLKEIEHGSQSPRGTMEPQTGGELINGPKLDGDSGHASQHDIDKMFG